MKAFITSREMLLFLLSALMAFEVWQTNKINTLVTSDAVQTTEIVSISKAVNNVGVNEKTIRELVVENQKTLEFIKGKFGSVDFENEIFDW